MRVTNRLERTARVAFLVLGLGALSGLAGAQQPTPAQASTIRQACRGDARAR